MTDVAVAPAVGGAPRQVRYRWPWVLVGAVLAVPVAVTLLWTGLNHDVRRTLGTLRVSEFPAADVFVQRPLAHRWLMAGLEALAPGGWRLGDAVARAVAMVCAAGAAWLLHRGLAGWLNRAEAAAISAAVGLALVLAPSWDFLQPEWVACVLAVAGTGLALSARRLPAAVLAGGGLLALAVLQKYVTVNVAVLALIVIFVLDRRRGLAVAAGCAVLSAAGFALSLALAPREWLWFKEMAEFNPASPLRGGDIAGPLRLLAEALANELVVAPLVALAPACVIVLARMAGGRAALAWVAWSVVGALVAVAPTFVQAQGFGYHLAVLPVLGAGLWALAATRRPAAGGGLRWLWVLGLPTALIVAATALTLSAPLDWRRAHSGAALSGVAIAAAAVAALALLARRRPASTPGAAWVAPVAALVAVCAVSVPVLPASGYAVGGYSGGYTNAAMRDYTILRMAAYVPARDQIGPRTRVVYTVYADDAYLLGNPTPCRYPQPGWLMVAKDLPRAREARGYQENVDCLLETDARYLVMYPAFIDGLEPQLAARVRDRWNCDRAIAAFDIVLCPRR